MENFWYVINNASFARLDKNFGKDVVGGISVVAAETLVAKILERTGMFGKAHDGMFRTGLVSATTIPLQGGFYNPVGPVSTLKANSSATDTAWYGASGIVPMLIAQYIVESSAGRLFHMPQFQIGDITMMATVKMITPFIFKLLGATLLEADGQPAS